MEYAKKMILVPEHVVSRHIPPDEKLSELDKEMKDILLSQMDDDSKIKLYNQVLQKRIQIDLLNPPTVIPTISTEELPDLKPETIEENDHIENLLLSAIPKRLTPVTKSILEVLKKNGDIMSWNPRGELIYKGQVVKNSNILNLINNMVRKQKDNTFLLGQVFREVLRDINLPHSFIKNESYDLQKGYSITPKVKNVTNKPYQWLHL